MRIRPIILAICVVLKLGIAMGEVAPAHLSSAGFVHPGLLHSQADLDRIRDNVKAGKEPWASAWLAFNQNNRWLDKNYTPRPLEIVGRGVGARGQDNISNDCTAAYYNAIAWYITGDEAYAKKSIEIMDAWAEKCRLINGKDAVLCAGIYGYKLLNAGEIIRYTYNGWKPEEIEQFKTLMRDVFYPVVKDFATFANGNWDGAAEATVISIGVFLDDRAIFDHATRYYMDGSGDGSILHYVINDTGQLQESGRDQAHSQLGIGLISCAAEVAYKQGVDLYGAYDNRLLKGFEYAARCNLGEAVPFQTTTDRTGKYVHERVAPVPKHGVQVYEMVYNHYVNEAGVGAPYTAKSAAMNRPETLAIDQVGGGTLLFTRPPHEKSAQGNEVPMIPGAVIAKGAADSISLIWPASVGATDYAVQRADNTNGPWNLLAAHVDATQYLDHSVEPGKLYFYKISASNAGGTSGDTIPCGASAGLLKPWRMADIGDGPVKGVTQYDGSIFRLETAGANIGGKTDQCHFVFAQANGDTTITARYVPQTASQFAQMGLMFRQSQSGDSPQVSMLVTPKATSDIEVPTWHLVLIARTSSDTEAKPVAAGNFLKDPFVTWGRLMAPFWLRLSRKGDLFTASFSSDGQVWQPIGETRMSLQGKALAGLAACSSIKGSTTVMFEQLSLIHK